MTKYLGEIILLAGIFIAGYSFLTFYDCTNSCQYSGGVGFEAFLFNAMRDGYITILGILVFTIGVLVLRKQK